METIVTSSYYLLPGIAEKLMNYANNNSNFGKYGMYLGIRNRRNIIYISQTTCVVLYIFNCKKTMIVFLLLFVIQMNSFINYLVKYKHYL